MNKLFIWIFLLLGAEVPLHAQNETNDSQLAQQTLAQLPPIAFIERAKDLLTGTCATMFAQVRGQGASVWVLDPQSGKKATRIFQTDAGMIFDISPSYDGRKLLMSYRTGPAEPFHIWEINADGSGLRQLTSGRYHDFNPVYYPDGRIVFSSSRVESYSMCQDFIACALYMMRADGSDIRRIDWTTLCSNVAAILPDGQILCTRWEYQDKTLFSWQGLWTIKPNGRQLSLYYGNTLTVPNARWGGKPIPGTDKVIFTMATHHFPPIGDIGIVDRRLGLENPKAITKLTSATDYKTTQGKNWRNNNWHPGDKYYPDSYTDPWPVSENLSLVSYGGETNGASKQFQIQALYHSGKTVPIYAEPDRSFFCPVSLNERPKPAVITGDAPQEPGFGTFYVQNVYEGLLEQGVKPGQVKALRVWQQLPKTYNTEGPRIHDQYPLIGFGTYYVKQILGTVPVSASGSAYFKVPSNAELYFQALDEDGKEIIRMGSVTQITTGETASCIGCHENRMSAPKPHRAYGDQFHRPPDEITPPSWGAGPVDYVKQVQPVWDKYCLECHSGPLPKGDVDLSGDKNRFFSMSFADLCRKNLVEYYYFDEDGPTGVFPAFGSGSWVSKLTKILESKHEGVDVDPESRRRVYAWIDSNVCYYPAYDMCRPHSAGGRDIWTEPGTTQPMDWLKRVSQIARDRKLNGFHQEDISDTARLTCARTYALINMTRPENSRLLSGNLAKSAGGGADDDKAAFASSNDPDYQALLAALREGAEQLRRLPRIDMPGAVAVPQKRDFGRTF